MFYQVTQNQALNLRNADEITITNNTIEAHFKVATGRAGRIAIFRGENAKDARIEYEAIMDQMGFYYVPGGKRQKLESVNERKERRDAEAGLREKYKFEDKDPEMSPESQPAQPAQAEDIIDPDLSTKEEKQQAVLALRSQGSTWADIARKVGVTESTAKRYSQAALEKEE